jgi:hypothetical protein
MRDAQAATSKAKALDSKDTEAVAAAEAAQKKAEEDAKAAEATADKEELLYLQ